MKIEVNYFDPNKPRGVVGGTPSIPLHGTFSFFSLDGTLEVQFQGDSPVPDDLPPKKLPTENQQFTASKAGTFTFQCFINGQPIPIGGELEVLPGM